MGDGHALHPLQAVEEYSAEVFQIAEGARALEQHDREVIAQQVGMPRDFQVAAIVPHPADQGEAAARSLSVHHDIELRQFLAHLREAAFPVAELAPSAFELGADQPHNARVQPDAGHAGEETGRLAGGRHPAQRDGGRLQLLESRRSAYEIAANACLHAQNVGRAGRQDGQRHFRARHSGNHFIDGAVSAWA
ncbi:MAG: hypothetical protein QM757_39835 [Paludibaculum sp.]